MLLISQPLSYHACLHHSNIPTTSLSLCCDVLCCAVLCCAVRYINAGGRERWNRSTPIGTHPRQPFPLAAHQELRQGYAAAVSFLDAQVGRLLDVIDELALWNDLTVVLTSDHGMHNGTV